LLFFPKGLSAFFVAGLIYSIFPPLRGKYFKKYSALSAALETLSEVEGERAVNIFLNGASNKMEPEFRFTKGI
jgi:hypothetical protein